MIMTEPTAMVASGAFGIAAGALSGFLGIGGGAILTPLFVLLLGFEQHRAQGISLAALLPPVGLPAVLAYRRAGVLIKTRTVLLLIAGFVAGALGGAWLAHRVSGDSLRWAFAAFLVLSAFRALRPGAPSEEKVRGGEETPGAASIALAIGAAAGVASGLLGVGGGLVALPLLQRFGGLGRLEAQATTLAMMLAPIGLPAVYMYAREQGGLPWPLLAAVALGFTLGAGVGALIAGRVPARIAARVYAVFLALTALVLIVRI
jgi:uncharacterized membrane protein YfcA